VFYIMPFIILFPNKGAEKKEISTFFLFGLPMIFYSIITALRICLFSRFKNKRMDKLA